MSGKPPAFMGAVSASLMNALRNGEDVVSNHLRRSGEFTPTKFGSADFMMPSNSTAVALGIPLAWTSSPTDAPVIVAKSFASGDMLPVMPTISLSGKAFAAASAVSDNRLVMF